MVSSVQCSKGYGLSAPYLELPEADGVAPGYVLSHGQ